ncbi:MAG: WXG100 family type VII secretion target [Oscillospiraceae bacterium]
MIDYNVSDVREAASALRSAAEMIAQEAAKIDTIISAVESGWVGAGANEYIQYLLNVRKNIAARVENINEIARLLDISADDAELADIMAAQQLASASSAAIASAQDTVNTVSEAPKVTFTK